MRIGKWVPIYKRLLPIPRRLSMAFGLFEGSQLSLSRIDDLESPRKHGAEIIVSSVPFASWRSACRLSVRLSDSPGALATASAFLRKKRMNILLSECCSTYQTRAHWDAICDMASVDGFSSLDDVPRHQFDEAMQAFLRLIETEFKTYAQSPGASPAFMQGPDLLVQLTPLTGLNDVSFVCKDEFPVEHINGAVEIEKRLAKEIIALCYSEGLPQQALITGNTEQRYMRVLFLRDYEQMFQLTVHDEIANFPGGGIGVLNQLLSALPPQINLMRASTYVVSKAEGVEKGRIELLGHWDLPHIEEADRKREYMRSTLERAIKDVVVSDIAGNPHPEALRFGDFVTPHGHHPRVFISYSTSHAKQKLQYLERALLAADFEPVLGTDMSQVTAETFVGDAQVTPDVAHTAFQAIHGCVAFVSLLVRREDYEIQNPAYARFVLPPWAVAEEVYAWSKNIPRIIRIKDAGVELPPYNRHAETLDFADDDGFERAVATAIEMLTIFRAMPQFRRIKENAREALFRKRPVPAE